MKKKGEKKEKKNKKAQKEEPETVGLEEAPLAEEIKEEDF